MSHPHPSSDEVPQAAEPATDTQPVSTTESTSPAAPAPAGTGSPSVLTAVMGLPAVAGRMWSGRLVEALRLSHSIPLFGWIGVGLAVLVLPLMALVVFGRAGMGLFNLGGRSVFGAYYSRSYFMFDGGDSLQLLLMLIVAAAVIVLLRVVTVWAALAWAGRRQSFGTAASLLTGAYAQHLLIAPVILVLALIPGDTVPALVAVLMMVLFAIAEFAASLALYTGINRLGPYPKSPLVPHVVCTAAWAALVLVAFYVILDVLGAVG